MRQADSAVKSFRNLQRRIFQLGFFVLFIFAPIFDIFRFDLNLGHFILFSQPWTLGLDPFLKGEAPVSDGIINLLLRGFLPLAGLIGFAFWVSWKYGRLYCGWLCPHFSVVETINNLMRRASGKFSLWDKKEMSNKRADGSEIPRNKTYWVLVSIAVLGFAFLWAVVLITYLLPPAEIYGNLFSAELSMRQSIFISAATVALSIEFMFARHLFCRFGCAVGVFQSFVWMANRKAMVVSFDRPRAKLCSDCADACDEVCPMRLKPRTIKRSMFTCTQCGQCLSACEQVQFKNNEAPVIRWKSGQDARQESDR